MRDSILFWSIHEMTNTTETHTQLRGLGFSPTISALLVEPGLMEYG
jgi:hypothetical protein